MAESLTRIVVIAVSLAFLGTFTSAQTTVSGKQLYQSRCVGCHGEDGLGGGHGPNIIEVARPRAASKTAVRDVIVKGIPDGGMPAFKLSAMEADALATFVMTLKSAPGASVSRDAVPGNPQAGEHFFFGKGDCSNCHMVRGNGGVLGPDLSTIGRDRRRAQIQQSLRDGVAPSAPAGRGSGRVTAVYPAVTVKLGNGQTLRGIAKNEGPFDLQLLGVDGKLHLLLRAEVTELVHEKTLMPPLKATPEETRDLVAFLSRLTPDPRGKSTLATGALGRGVPFTDVANPKPGTWPTYDGTPTGNRFSPLQQINTKNVEHLAPKWMFTLPGTPRSLEVTPIVVDGVMYVTSVNERMRSMHAAAARYGIIAGRDPKGLPATQPAVLIEGPPSSVTEYLWLLITLT